jgi:DNA polymerase IV
MTDAASVVHLNVVGFPSAVAITKDPALADRVFVVAGAQAARAIVLDVSRRALELGLEVGLPLTVAQRTVQDLLVLPPDSETCAAVNAEMEQIAARYAPVVQNDSGGHLYLDLAGTARLFGPHIDVAVRIKNEIIESIGVEPVVAVARNKLVAKVATRSIRPDGIAYIRGGEETAFLASQDARLLPGVGPAVSRALSVVGLRSIGEIAALSDTEAYAFLGKKGLALRDAALGLDSAPVVPGGLGERVIRRRADFAGDVLDASVIRGALVAVAEDAGLELRKSILAASCVRVTISYADGVRTEAVLRSKRPLALDADIIAAADRAYAKAGERRVRVRGLSLFLQDFTPAGRERDLFIPERSIRLERLQTAVDAARRRYGPAAVTRAAALAAMAPSGAAAIVSAAASPALVKVAPRA